MTVGYFAKSKMGKYSAQFESSFIFKKYIINEEKNITYADQFSW